MNQFPVVLQVLPTLEMGGVERGTIEMAAALQQASIKNYVISAGGPMVRELEKMGIPHILMPVQSKNPLTIWRNVGRLSKVIKDKGITLIHVRSRAPAWSVKYASARTGVPFITTYHGVYGLKPAWLKRPYNRVMTEGVKVIAVSDFVKRHIMENYDVPADKIETIYRGADIRRFNPERVVLERVTDLMKAFQIPPEKPVITLVGRLTKIKGHSVLLEALKQMLHKDVTCLFVGSDQGRTEYTEELKQQIRELSPQTDVRMVQSCSDMPALYLMSDIIVNASIVPESFGRTVTEAQAMGRIVIASAHGGACETIADGETGYLVPPGDAAALAARLDAVLDLSVGDRKRIQAAGIKSVRERFSIQRMCEQTIDLYRKVSL